MFKIRLMNLFDDGWLGQVENVVIEPYGTAVIGKSLAAIVLFLQLVALDDGADGSVQDYNPAVEDFLQLQCAVAVRHRIDAQLLLSAYYLRSLQALPAWKSREQQAK